MIDFYCATEHWLEAYWIQIVASMQAMFCGGCAYQIGFRFHRGKSSYNLMLSVCAFGLASLCAQQWLSIVSRVLMYGSWPVVSFYNTLVFAILFVLLNRSKGNVSKMFDFHGEGSDVK